MWGLKPIGITIALLSTAGGTAALVYGYVMESKNPSIDFIFVAAFALLMLLLWIAIVTPSWVRIPAEAYGRQLLAACDTLNSQTAPRRKS